MEGCAMKTFEPKRGRLPRWASMKVLFETYLAPAEHLAHVARLEPNTVEAAARAQGWTRDPVRENDMHLRRTIDRFVVGAVKRLDATVEAAELVQLTQALTRLLDLLSRFGPVDAEEQAPETPTAQDTLGEKLDRLANR